jgi:polyisoprenyl-phosphate glycosyltransferase
MTGSSRPRVSIVLPCYNEEQALPSCVAALHRYVAAQPPGAAPIEVVFVDDGSRDGTWAALTAAVEGRPHWHAVRLMTNRGSHVALRCAYRHTSGERVVNLPVDLQDPVDNIDRLAEAMDRTGADGVLAVRRSRVDGLSERLTSRLYHGAMHLVGLKNIPVEGTSQFLLSRRVVDQINAHEDRGFTFEGFLASAPLRLEIVWYDRTGAERESRWTLGRKIQHALDTILGFSNTPIRALSLVGASVALIGLIYAAFVVVRFAITGGSWPGWPSLMTVVLVLGGLNLLALGLVGEYLWRILDESRRRPLYQIADQAGVATVRTDDRHVHEHI